ncbi:MAG: TonB-dependent receptor, partial [Pseudomonadota bacterium]
RSSPRVSTAGGADAGALVRNQDDDSFVQEIRLRYDDGGPFRALIGAYYGTFDNQSVDSFFIPTSFVSPRLPPGTVFQDRTFSTQEENIAIFGEIEWDVIDAVTLILGARYDDESRDFTALSTTTSDPQLPPGFLPLDELIENSTSYDAFLPKFGVRFNLSDYVTLGATVQRAYRAGGTDVAIVSGEINEFDPEYTWNYEMSVRAQTPDNSFAVQGNVFYTKWTDQIVEQITLFGQTNGVPIDTLAVNAGESEVYGFELSMEARPSRTLDTFLSLGYVHTEFTDFVTATGELAGNRFNNASPFTVSAGFDWEHPTGFRVLGDVNLRDGFFSVIDNDTARITTEPILGPGGAVVGQFERCDLSPCNDPRTRVEAAVVVNLRAGYEAETWSIYAFARNLLDEDYITQRNAPNNFSPLGLVRTGEPRVLGVEFNVSFGG